MRVFRKTRRYGFYISYVFTYKDSNGPCFSWCAAYCKTPVPSRFVVEEWTKGIERAHVGKEDIVVVILNYKRLGE